MLNEEIIQINKFSKLHDNKKIIFCKTDYILKEFQTIKNIENNIILITGNSDYSVDDRIAEIIPDNIKQWYAQNCITNNQKVNPIPMGIENKFNAYRNGHGISYPERVELKESLLCRNKIAIPEKLIYANFNCQTNLNYRIPVRDICKSSIHIDWEEYSLTIQDFFDKILEYKMIVCPIGKGIDTHRLWEVLYSGRIPITIKVGDYKIYKLYEKLPIIILNSINELNDIDLINHHYEQQINKDITMGLFSYWKNKILKQVKND